MGQIVVMSVHCHEELKVVQKIVRVMLLFCTLVSKWISMLFISITKSD